MVWIGEWQTAVTRVCLPFKGVKAGAQVKRIASDILKFSLTIMINNKSGVHLT